jgi:hypothetical protein
MPQIQVYFKKAEYFPGDLLEGEVVIRTRSAIECNRVGLKIVGKEYTEMGSGDTRVKDSYYHFNKYAIICKETSIPEGDTRLPFSFRLPNGIPPTFKGYYGHINYHVEVVIEQNWRIDPKRKSYFLVSPKPLSFIHPSQRLESRIRKQGALSVDMPSNVVRPDGLPLSVRVEPRSRVDEVRIQLIRRERYKCQSRKKNRDRVILGVRTPITERDFERWKEFKLPKHIRPDFTFRGNLMQVGYLLKFTLGVSLGFDDIINIPVQFSAPQETEKEIEEKDMDELLDDIALDLEF